MGKWKPWQQFAFLAYLLALNTIVLGSLAYLIFSEEFGAGLETTPAPQVAAMPSGSPSAVDLPAPLVETGALTSTLEPGNIVAATSAPPLHIPPASIPTSPDALTSPTGSATPILSGAFAVTAQAVAITRPGPTATDSSNPPAEAHASSPTPQPTATPTATPLPTATPTNSSTPTLQPTATATHTPEPTATLTHTPRPADTATSIPTVTLSPTPTMDRAATRMAALAAAILTRTPTHTPRPTPTFTHTPTDTPQPTATFTRAPTQTPTATATPTATLHSTVTASPTTSAAQEAPPVAVAALVDDNTPASASGLVKAIPLTNDSIALNWSPLETVSQYRVYSDVGSGYGVYIYKAHTTQPAFIDELLRPGMAYSYRVTHLAAGKEAVIAQADAATHGDETTAGTTPVELTSPTVRVTPAPTALPPDAVLLGLRSDNNFTDNFNTLTVVGEVRNDSNLDVGQTDIAITFYDDTGAVVGAANGQTMLEVIPPGEISPFVITLTRPPGLASYSLRAVARPVTPKRSAQLSVVEVRRYEDDAGFFHVKGVVKNVGNLTARRTKVAAVIYGRDNRVINVGFTYTNPPTLSPGATATYDVTFTYYPKYVTQTVIPFEE